jgi:hypothetical protein
LDHLVMAVHDLPAAMDRHREMGFQVVVGGKHPGRLSHNALVVFQDGSYIELIAWSDAAPDEAWWRILQAQGEGLIDFALLPHDTGAFIASARSRGLNRIEGPLDGGRTRPDGRELKWTTARQASRDLPFLCGDVTPRRWRVPEGDLRVHPNGVLGIALVNVSVLDLDSSVLRYRQLLGNDVNISMAPGQATIEISSCLICLHHRPHDVEGPMGFEFKRPLSRS